MLQCHLCLHVRVRRAVCWWLESFCHQEWLSWPLGPPLGCFGCFARFHSQRCLGLDLCLLSRSSALALVQEAELQLLWSAWARGEAGSDCRERCWRQADQRSGPHTLWWGSEGVASSAWSAAIGLCSESIRSSQVEVLWIHRNWLAANQRTQIL